MAAPLFAIVLVALTASALHPIPSDAGSGHDADDLCVAGHRPTITVERDVDTYGFFAPPNDRLDHYAVDVPESGYIEVKLMPGPLLPRGLPLPDHDLAVFTSSCVQIAASSQPGNTAEYVEVDQPAGTYVVVLVRVPESSPVRSAMYCDPFCVTVGYHLRAMG